MEMCSGGGAHEGGLFAVPNILEELILAADGGEVLLPGVWMERDN